MGFASIGALFALLLAAAPVLIHWSRRRDVPERPLPTARMLRTALRHRRRRRRIVDLLLLLTRVGMVVLLVLLLARPYVEHTTHLSLDRPVAFSLVLDDSASMYASDLAPNRFEAARRRALRLLEELPLGSEVSLVLGGRPAHIAFERLDPKAAATRLRGLSPRPPRGTDLAMALRLARRAAGRAGIQQRATVVLSDLSRHALEGVAPFLDTRETLRWMRIGPAPGEPLRTNLTIDALQALLVEGAERTFLRFEAHIVRHGPKLRSETPRSDEVHVELWDPERERRLAERRVHLAGRDVRWRGEVTLSKPPRFVEARIDTTDILVPDDRRTALVRPFGETPLLLVDGDPHPHYVDDELGLLNHVLEALGPRAPSRRIVDAAGLRPEEVRRAHVVLLADPPPDAISPESLEAIEALLRRGGSLFVAPGDRSDAFRIAHWFEGWLPAHPATPQAIDLEGLHEPDGTPAMGWRHTRTRRRTPFEALHPDSRTWLRFPDGEAVVLARPTGHGGWVVLSALPLDASWSDWTLRPGFVMRWPRWWKRLEGRAQRDRELPVGDAIPLPSHISSPRLEAVAASLPHPPPLRPGGPLRLPAPGPWLMRGTDGASVRLAAVLPPEESDLEPGEPPDTASRSDRGPHRATGGVSRTLHVRREPAHGPLLWMLLVLLLLEGLLRDPFSWRLLRPPPRGGTNRSTGSATR